MAQHLYWMETTVMMLKVYSEIIAGWQKYKHLKEHTSDLACVILFYIPHLNLNYMHFILQLNS